MWSIRNVKNIMWNNTKLLHFCSVNSLILVLETKNIHTNKQTTQFYDTFLLYIEKRGSFFEDISLNPTNKFPNMVWYSKKYLNFILQNNNNKRIGRSVNEDILFDEYNRAVNVINDNLQEWQNNSVRIEDKWLLSIQF